MAVRIVIALLLALAAFLSGVKVENWRNAALREKIQLAEEDLRKERLLTNAMVGELAALREEKQRVVYRKIVERIPELVPAGSCDLPAGWRVLHDAAARREDPPAGPVDHGSPVPAQAAGRTVASNYEEHHRVADRLEDCQRYIREVVRPEGLK